MTITITQPAPNSVALGMTTLDITPVIEMETRSACKVGWETTVKKVFCFLEYFSEDSSINTSFFSLMIKHISWYLEPVPIIMRFYTHG